MVTIYLAGGLFNAGERLHNLFLEKHLKALGYKVILPQREATKFVTTQGFDLPGVVADCQKQASNKENIYVGSVDGADADSGTAVEYGMAITATGTAIIYRTDFRTALEKELGVNAMFLAQGTEMIYLPCFFTELNQVDEYYCQLAQSINQKIQSLNLV